MLVSNEITGPVKVLLFLGCLLPRFPGGDCGIGSVAELLGAEASRLDHPGFASVDHFAQIAFSDRRASFD